MGGSEGIGGILGLAIIALCAVLGFKSADILWLLGIAVMSSLVYATLLRPWVFGRAAEMGIGGILQLVIGTYVTQLLTVGAAYGVGWLVSQAF